MTPYCPCNKTPLPETATLRFSVGKDGAVKMAELVAGDVIEWGDGTTDTATAATASHTYSGAAYPVQATVTYSTKTTGNYSVSGQNVTEIVAFPTGAYRVGMQFLTCTALTKVPELLPSYITSLWSAFYRCTSFNQDLSSWYLGRVTTTQYMFAGAIAFNQPVAGWDMRSNTNMRNMFQQAISFNQSVAGWDTSKVTDMRNMFQQVSKFNEDLSSWDTGNVTNMSYMFAGATSFNGDISGWNTGKVTTMQSMFDACFALAQDLSAWNTSSVTNMTGMFNGATSFVSDLSGWCVTNIASEPTRFSTGSNLTAADKPVWGTCPQGV